MPTNTLDPMYGQYNLLPAPGIPFDGLGPSPYEPDPDKYIWPNGIASLQSPAWMTIICGNHRELVKVTLEKLDEAPGDPSDEWEIAVDLSMFNPTGELEVRNWDGVSVENLRIGVPPADSWVRVRVQATQRREHAEHTKERHLIQVWSSPEAPEVVHRMDEYGQQRA